MSSKEATSSSEAAAACSNHSTLRIPHIKPPKPINLSECTAKSWKLWKQLWQNYSVVTRLDSQEEQYQKALFLCTIGESALEIYNAFDFAPSENPDKVSSIISKFDQYFTGDINETYERFKFNQRQQATSENFDTYLTELRNMRKTCNFCECLSDSLLRDRIVLGIRDDGARKRLLQERSLDLKKCIDICKSAENAITHLGAMAGKSEEVMGVFKGAKESANNAKAPGSAIESLEVKPRKSNVNFA